MSGPLTPRLDRVYRRTCYRAGGTIVRVGHRSVLTDRLLHVQANQAAVFVTAWNPHSRRMPPEWNARMQRALRARLRYWRVLDGEGRWRAWREAMLLVLAPEAPMIRLARVFRQHAVVVVRRGAPARLHVL